MDLARTIRHVESFRVPRPRPPYNNDIMRWGEKITVRVHILYPHNSQCLPTARFGRVIELVAVYYYIIFAKKREGRLWPPYAVFHCCLVI